MFIIAYKIFEIINQYKVNHITSLVLSSFKTHLKERDRAMLPDTSLFKLKALLSSLAEAINQINLDCKVKWCSY